MYYVYIMANRTRRLYIVVTNDLCRRVYEHKHRLVLGFTSKYFIERLVYFEDTDDVSAAIAREKELKEPVLSEAEGLAPLEENRADTKGESPMVRPEPWFGRVERSKRARTNRFAAIPHPHPPNSTPLRETV